MFCVTCGKKVKRNLAFCPFCGAKSNPLNDNSFTIKNSKNKMIKRIIIIIISLISLGGGFSIVYNNVIKSTPQKTIEKFEKAYNESDWKELIECVDNKTKNEINSVISLSNSIIGLSGFSVEIEDLFGFSNAKISVIIETITYYTKETVVCDVTINGEKEKIYLKKDNKKWLIDGQQF